MEIEKHENDVVAVLAQICFMRSGLFEVEGLCGYHERALLGGPFQLRQRVGVAIDGQNVKSVGGEKQGMTAASGCDIESGSLGESMKLLHEKWRRSLVGFLKLLPEPGPLQ